MLLISLEVFEIVVSFRLVKVYLKLIFPHCIYFTLYSVFKIRFDESQIHHGGHKWTRTIDLTLIRRAL